MSQFIPCKISWTDNSSGNRDELGTEIDIYTDSPSFAPNVPVASGSGAPHGWMRLPAVAPGEVSAEFRLETPVTFIRVRVRQYNADGPGEWDVPTGTLFTIAQPAGPLAPPAVSAVGFVVTDAVVVPPPPPPVEPPPPPPPTGGSGSAANYVFVNQFSGVQGQNQWSYRDTSGNDLVYNAATSIWEGAQSYQWVWSSGFHPGTSVGTVVRWTAPANGTAIISGSSRLTDSTLSTGVVFTIKHNATSIHTETITDGVEHPYSETEVMLSGEYIDFILEPNGNNSYDGTTFAPTINFTTNGITPANPTVSSLSPSTLGVAVGAVQGLTVTLSSAPSSVASVAVSSSDPTKATVPATVSIAAGQLSANVPVTGVAAGSSTITATYNSSNKTAAVTVSNPASSSWVNAPAGGTVLVDSAFNDINGFIDDYPVAGSNIETISDAPFSPSKALVHRLYPLAPTGGGQLRCSSAPTRYREMYIGLWWRTNPQFQGRIPGNKLFFIRGTPPITNGVFLFNNAALNNGQGTMIFSVNTSGIFNGHILGGNNDPSAAFFPNVGNGTLTRGVWHKLEASIRCSTTRTSRDGTLKWWINDNLVGYYENFNYCGPNGEFNDEICINETWDGAQDMGISNTVTWEHVYDHCIVVGKN